MGQHKVMLPPVKPVLWLTKHGNKGNQCWAMKSIMTSLPEKADFAPALSASWPGLCPWYQSSTLASNVLKVSKLVKKAYICMFIRCCLGR